MRVALYLVLGLLLSCQEGKKDHTADVVGSTRTAPIEERPSIEKAPDSNIPVYDFNALQPLLQKKNDTTYIVNFWATWCKPCIKELPYFEKVNEAYAEKKVKVLLVSLDFPDILESQVQPFVEKRGLQSEVVLLDDPDANSWIPKVDAEWSGAIPATLMYNKANRVFFEKSFTQEELETELQSIL